MKARSTISRQLRELESYIGRDGDEKLLIAGAWIALSWVFYDKGRTNPIGYLRSRFKPEITRTFWSNFESIKKMEKEILDGLPKNWNLDNGGE